MMHFRFYPKERVGLLSCPADRVRFSFCDDAAVVAQFFPPLSFKLKLSGRRILDRDQHLSAPTPSRGLPRFWSDEVCENEGIPLPFFFLF